MFILIALLTLGLVAFFTIRDRVRTPRFSSKSIQNSLKLTAQYISLGDWDRATKELTPLLDAGKGGKEAALYEIQVLRGTNRLKAALKQVEQKSREYPEELLFRLEEGKILLSLNQPRDAIEAFNVCAPIMRGETDLFFLASAFYHAGFANHCFELLKPFLSKTRNGELLSLAADALFELKKFKEAIDIYFHAMELGFKTYHLFIQLGHAFRRLGNLSESEKIFRKLLEKDPGDVAATLGLGACMQERGHYHKALLIYQASSAWETKDRNLMKQAGLSALRSKKFHFAEAYFCEVIQKEDPEPQMLAYFGLALEGQKKWQQAEQVYIRLIQLFPTYPHGYRALAWLFGVGLSTTLSNEQGINYAYFALKLKNDILAWEILSAVHARVGNFDKAYQIQLSLAEQDKDTQSRARRQQALRKLRKRTPLDNHHIIRAMVA